jgi:hypothetical protein
MNDSLNDVLRALLQSDAPDNPALDRLIDDYALYHAVLLVVGGLFLLGLVALTSWSWKRFVTSPRTADGRWSFERKTFAGFGVGGGFLSLLMTVTVAANLSTALNPRPGFDGVVDLLPARQAGSPAAELQQSFASWLTSGSSQLPPAIQTAVNDRLAWQLPKAVICSVLLVLFVGLCVRQWRGLIRASHDGRSRTMRRRVQIVAGVGSAVFCVLLMLMVIGNTQASIAPLALTMING